MRFWVHTFCLFILLCALTSCATIEHHGTESKGGYKVGNPYSVKGQTYYPKVNYDYDETGIASWYGPGFDGKRTANGERFYQNELTGAHKTLPMPSIVRVTNLSNGKSLVVRINDRGPYARGRLIDVSTEAAKLLGFKNIGTAKVRVQVLEQESKRIAQAAMNGISTRGTEIAMNEPGYPGVVKVSHTKNSPKPTSILGTDKYGSVPGHITNGNFYPDPILSAMPVQPTYIFVQAGSFSSKENALKLSQSLGNAVVREAMVNGMKFYRVRIPAKNVDEADLILNTVIKNGNKNAIIVVE